MTQIQSAGIYLQNNVEIKTFYFNEKLQKRPKPHVFSTQEQLYIYIYKYTYIEEIQLWLDLSIPEWSACLIDLDWDIL